MLKITVKKADGKLYATGSRSDVLAEFAVCMDTILRSIDEQMNERDARVTYTLLEEVWHDYLGGRHHD